MISGDNNESDAWLDAPTMTLYIQSYTVKRLADNVRVVNSYSGPTLNSTNKDDLLERSDSKVYSRPTVNGYEWEIKWRFVISETLDGYSRSYSNSRVPSFSDGDTYPGGGWSYSEGSYWEGDGFDENSDLSSSNQAEYRGTYKAITCTLVVQAPTCTLSVNRGPSGSNAGNFVPETEEFDSGRDKHLGNSYLNSREAIVFPVGQQGVSRTQLRAQNYNPFEVETNNTYYPEYEIETQSLGDSSLFPTDGFYPQSVRTQTQPVINIYDAYDPSLPVPPGDYSRNGTVSYIPERRPYLNNGIDNSLNFPRRVFKRLGHLTGRVGLMALPGRITSQVRIGEAAR